MTTAFTWHIANLERETTDGYVYTAHYTVDAKDDAYSAGAYGSVGLVRPEAGMIPYADLTADICIQWVKDQLGAEKVTEIEAALQAQLDEQRSPSRAAGVPWASGSM